MNKFRSFKCHFCPHIFHHKVYPSPQNTVICHNCDTDYVFEGNKLKYILLADPTKQFIINIDAINQKTFFYQIVINSNGTHVTKQLYSLDNIELYDKEKNIQTLNKLINLKAFL